MLENRRYGVGLSTLIRDRILELDGRLQSQMLELKIEDTDGGLCEQHNGKR